MSERKSSMEIQACFLFGVLMISGIATAALIKRGWRGLQTAAHA